MLTAQPLPESQTTAGILDDWQLMIDSCRVMVDVFLTQAINQKQEVEPDYQQWDGASGSHTERRLVLNTLRVCSHVTHTPPQWRRHDLVSEIYKHIYIKQQHQPAEMIRIHSEVGLPVSEWCWQTSDVITHVACSTVLHWDPIWSVVDSEGIVNHNCELLVLREDRMVQPTHGFRRSLEGKFRVREAEPTKRDTFAALWTLSSWPACHPRSTRKPPSAIRQKNVSCNIHSSVFGELVRSFP